MGYIWSIVVWDGGGLTGLEGDSSWEFGWPTWVRGCIVLVVVHGCNGLAGSLLRQPEKEGKERNEGRHVGTCGEETR